MVVILMGVSGTGKTTLGMRLAGDLSWRFVDADDYLSPELASELGQGQLPSDEEMTMWMDALGAEVQRMLAQRENAVVACSALKSGYRSRLSVDPNLVRFVHLKGSASLVRRRLRSRSGQFLREALLASQFAALEEPQNAVTISIDERPGRIVEKIRAALGV